MPIVINTNLNSITAQRSLETVNRQLTQSIQRLSERANDPAEQGRTELRMRGIADHAHGRAGRNADRISKWHQEQRLVIESDHFGGEPLAGAAFDLAMRAQRRHDAARLEGHAD